MPYIKRIKIQNLRNLTDIALELSPSVNIFFGNNGSGKTTFLEAITLLGLGRSFRTHKSKNIIQYDHDALTVFGELNVESNKSIRLGIQKDKKGDKSIKIDGVNVYSSSLLAKNFPLQLINAKSFQLLEGSPRQRCQFLDWMVFHVKPDFMQSWILLQKVIKHRNSILRRDKIDYEELLSWDKEFIRLAELLHHLRYEVFTDFKERFAQLVEPINQGDSLELDYYRGWNSEKTFEEVLKETLNKDCQLRYTQNGPHRSDLKIKINNRDAIDVLSRGQEKSLICRLHIGQSKYYQSKLKKNCAFLIDDMLSELDIDHQISLVNHLDNLNDQVFVTGVDKEELFNIWRLVDRDIAMFHVKHGNITRVN
ncbi:MAG: DNA replication/repair protein RecF [Gammaproteobacteria bacterium]|nr:DNA replication/repair protein RecF [Gammaproteobacteria bacterium]